MRPAHARRRAQVRRLLKRRPPLPASTLPTSTPTPSAPDRRLTDREHAELIAHDVARLTNNRR